MNCPLCQTENSDDAVFCQKCGYNFPANADLQSAPTVEIKAQKNQFLKPLAVVCIAVVLLGLCGIVGGVGLYFRNRPKDTAFQPNSNSLPAPVRQPTVMPTAVPKYTPAIPLPTVAANTIPNASSPMPSGLLTTENFNRLKVGMTYQEVVQIIGQGKLVSQNQFSDRKVDAYQWSGSHSKFISCTFVNGKLSGKSQFGL